MADRPRIFVLAGTNGAGKSSLLGSIFAEATGVSHFDPDATARAIREANPAATIEEANVAAWREGKRLLETSIDRRIDLAIETTLGGETFVGLFEKAAASGIEVRVWYVGLASPELHLARVAARVARGGHDIPEAKIRERYDKGREHLIRLLPALTGLDLFDNSEAADPQEGDEPSPRLILRLERGVIQRMCPPVQVPEWAKPIVLAALKL